MNLFECRRVGGAAYARPNPLAGRFDLIAGGLIVAESGDCLFQIGLGILVLRHFVPLISSRNLRRRRARVRTSTTPTAARDVFNIRAIS